MHTVRLTTLILVLVIGLSACGGKAPTEVPSNVTVVPTATVHRVDPPYTNVHSNGIITFTDTATGISLAYPENWLMDQVRGGTRSPSVFVFTNFHRIPAVMDSMSENETAVYLTVLQTKPDQTLQGLIDSFKQQWAGEGSQIVSEENVTLNSGQTGTVLYVDLYINRRYYYLFTSVRKMLVYIEGQGDLAPVPAVALTVR